MRLDIKTRSERVKAIDMHPTEPWVLAVTYEGTAFIANYQTGATIQTLEVSEFPLRACKFVPRKNWIVLGGDDFHIRVFSYNTYEKIAQFEAHPDYIRSIDVHPTQPFLLTSSDDTTVKLWNWDLNWKNTQTFEGHSHFVMYVAFNPKDPNTFASASLDQTVKVWSLGSSTPNFTLHAHKDKGVNWVQYYPRSDKPYLITSSDDQTVCVWDYQTKFCLSTMKGHTHNVSFAVYHPELPIIISGGEDNTVRIWNAVSYRLEQTLNYGLERAWCITCKPNSNLVAVGFDTGITVLQLGKEDPAVSMDGNGRLIWSKQSEAFTSIVKRAADSSDGEILSLSQKELGNVEVYPTQLIHSPNGRFVAVAGDGEYIIYTALAWRNKSFGSGVELCWSADSNEYAVREDNGSIKSYKNFKERNQGHFEVPFDATRIFGGHLLTVKGGSGDDSFVAFYDWDSGQLVRRVDADAQQIIWNESGELVAVVTDDSFYVLQFNRTAFEDGLQKDEYDPEEGVEEAFSIEHEINEGVRTGKWAGDSFIYTTVSNRLSYIVGGQAYTISHFDRQMYLLGYLPKDNAVFLCDKEVNVVSYHLSLAVVEYQTVVLRGDMDYAAEILDNVPEQERTKMARFLEAQGYEELALEVTRDKDHKFDLAISQKKLDIAKELIAAESDAAANTQKWRMLGDAALVQWNVDLAVHCFEQAKDLESLLLIYTSNGNKKKAIELAKQSSELGKYNVAFQAYWYCGDVDSCIDLLCSTNRPAEAAMFALTYGGDVTGSVKKWKDQLTKADRGKIASLISSPDAEPDVFPAHVGQRAPKAQAQPETTAGDLIDLDDLETNEKEEPEAEAEPKAESEAVEAEEAKVEAEAEATETTEEAEPEAAPEEEEKADDNEHEE